MIQEGSGSREAGTWHVPWCCGNIQFGEDEMKRLDVGQVASVFLHFLMY